MRKAIHMMGRRLCLAATLLGLCLAAAIIPAQAGNAPVLREQIKVFGELVTLGDLFESAGEAADQPVFRSPDLGKSGIVSARRIETAAARHGLAWPNPGKIDEVKVQRPGRLIEVQEVKEAIAARLAGEGETWLVTFNRGTKPFHIDPRVESPVTVKHIDRQKDTGAFRAIIAFEGASVPVPDKTFTGRAFVSVEAIVASRKIERGATIVEEDLKSVRLPSSDVSQSAIEDPADAIGMAATRTLMAGRPVNDSDLEAPKLVKRNGMVTILFDSPGLVLKAKGRAQADGSLGQVIQVTNLQSRRTIEAQVTAPGVVSVSELPESRQGRQVGNPPAASRPVNRSRRTSGRNVTHVIR